MVCMCQNKLFQLAQIKIISLLKKTQFPGVKAGGYTKKKYFRDSFVYIRHQLAFPTWGNAKTL